MKDLSLYEPIENENLKNDNGLILALKKLTRR